MRMGTAVLILGAGCMAFVLIVGIVEAHVTHRFIEWRR